MRLTAASALCLALLTAGLGVARAAPPDATGIPEPLKPWTAWVLKGQDERACPPLPAGDGRRCLWPGAVKLEVDDKGGNFALNLRSYAPGLATLPGSIERWPLEVQLDGKPALIQTRGGKPAVLIDAGAHQITGRFLWPRLPEALDLPADVGLIDLTVNGQRVAFPVVDAAGRTFLKSTAGAEGVGATDSLDLQVFRQVHDDIPVRLTTRVELKVAGRNREVTIGPVLDGTYTPVSVESDLPATLEPDGRVRVQARPGDFAVTIVARHNGPVESVKRPPAADPWPAEEIWVFAAQNQLRLVTVEGAAAVDPQQTSLPGDWKRLPAYMMAKDTVLELKTRKRGDPDPAPDRLGLERNVWLDFDGGGYAIRDRVTGTVSRSWRLEVQQPAVLGRASTDGKDQLITHGADAGAGIEVRRGQLQLEADLRIPERTSVLPATAWRADFQSVGANLHLPPGYKLLAALGVDSASGTWLKSWDLLNIFVVLLVALALAKLLGKAQGIVALLALTLVIPEADAPKYIWLALVPLLALLKYLPAGRIRNVVAVFHGALGVALVLMSLLFAVHQIRAAVFPSLEYSWKGLEGGSSADTFGSAVATAGSMAKMAEDAGDEATVTMDAQQEMQAPPMPAAPAQESYRGRAEKKMKSPSLGKGAYQNRQLAEVDPNATVQTGPGLPNWSWNQFQLAWNGPVRQDQTFRLIVMPPFVNALVSFLRVLLLFYMIVVVFGFKWGRFSRWAQKLTVASVLLAAVLAPGAREARADDFPSDGLLNQLRERLLGKPDCTSECATLSRLKIEADADQLTLLVEAHAAAETQIPLPGNGAHWLPAEVLVDGAQARELRREVDGALWLALSPGVHKIELRGRLPRHETVQIPLPLKPRRVDFASTAWSIDGLREDGGADDNLMLVRTSARTGGQAPGEPQKETASAIAPFVRVERTVELGLTWTVQTRVVRLGGAGSAAGGAVVIRVPLLPGEKVLTAGARVDKGAVLVNMGPKEASFSWTGALDIVPALTLKAPETLAWTEWWRVSLSPVWHLETKGIPVIHHVDDSGERLPEWRPWPGETVELTVSRPEGLVGQSLTMDRAFLDVHPGIRSSDQTLTLSLRSSRGGEHKLVLPKDVELQSVTINGAAQPIRLEGGALTLPIVPGAQAIGVTWRDANGMSLIYRTTPLDLGLPGVNATVSVAPPSERWVLFLGGDGVGPAILFWSQLIVVALAAFALGKIPLAPINSRQWFMLGIGLLQSTLLGVAVVVGFFLALGARRTQLPRVKSTALHNLAQLALVFWGLVAMATVIFTLEQGFFGRPDMQIAGNGSSAQTLIWFKDRVAGAMPTAWILSVPMFVYQVAMLLWALWFAFAAVKWSRWVFESFTSGGIWKSSPKPPAPAPAPVPAKAEGPEAPPPAPPTTLHD